MIRLICISFRLESNLNANDIQSRLQIKLISMGLVLDLENSCLELNLYQPGVQMNSLDPDLTKRTLSLIWLCIAYVFNTLLSLSLSKIQCRHEKKIHHPSLD